MSNDNKQNQKPNDKTPTTTPAQERAMQLQAKHDKIRDVVVAWLRNFYGAGTDVQKGMGLSAELWDLRPAPRGLMASVIPRSGAAAMQFAIMVSDHKLHIKPSLAKEMLDGWKEIVEAGILRS